MPTKRCGFGFNCGSMMQSPGLDPANCPNFEVCGSVADYSPEEIIEFRRARAQDREARTQARQQARIEYLSLTAHQLADLMLMSRGCPQSLDSLGFTEALVSVDTRLSELRECLQQYQDVYIAPTEVEAHRYNVKRPRGTYWYNKLLAASPIFQPSVRDDLVRVIHLSHDDDSRNLAAREGIQRRNKLLAAAVRLRRCEELLVEVLAEL